MTTQTKIRRALLASLLAGSTIFATGCTNGRSFSLASLNPFSAQKISQNKADGESAIAKSKDVLDRSKKAVTGVFADKSDSKKKTVSNVDPLRLDHKSKVGPEVFVANGRLWESTGNSKKAMESYVRALEVKENDHGALASIARLHFKDGNNKQAIEFFQRAIKQKPNDPSLHNDLGLTYSKAGNHSSASMMLERALELSPGVSRYANNLASVKFKAGDSAGAYKVLASNNKPAVAHYNMAYLHHKSGQLNDARTQLQAALEYTPQSKSDSSIARAVESSRTLLTQMDGPDAIANVGKKAADISQVAQQKPVQTVRPVSQQTSRTNRIPVQRATMRTNSETTQSISRFASAKLGSKTPKVPAKPAAPTIVPEVKLPTPQLPKVDLSKVKLPEVKLPTPSASSTPSIPGGPYVLPPDFGSYGK